MGWCLLPLLAALILVVVTGYDLQYQLLAWINRAFGPAAVTMLVSGWMVWQWLAWMGTGCSLFTLPAVLLGMHLHPRRFGWWYVAVVGWCLMRPAIPMMLITWTRAIGPWWNGGLVGTIWQTGWNMPVIAFALWAADAAVLGLLTRSRIVAAIAALAGVMTPAGFVGFHFHLPLDNWLLSTPWFWGWHFVVGASLLWWGFWARRTQKPPYECLACGYDLRGGHGPVCPECGSPYHQTAQAKAPTESVLGA